MDPNETLKNIRADLKNYAAAETNDEEHEIALDVIYGFEALDEWLTSGGFLPSAWKRP